MIEPGRAGRLTEEQRTRLEIARSDLERARAADLVAKSPPELIMMIETLRAALDDALRLVNELSE